MAGTENRDLIAQAEALERDKTIATASPHPDAPAIYVMSPEVVDGAIAALRAAAQPPAAQPKKPDNAIALVSSDDADSLYATVQWLLNPLPGGSLLFERPDPRLAELEGLLREAHGAIRDNGTLKERIAAALKEG